MSYFLQCPSCGRGDRIVNVQRVSARHRYKVDYCPVEDLTYDEVSVTDVSYEDDEFCCEACEWRCAAQFAVEQLIVPA